MLETIFESRDLDHLPGTWQTVVLGYINKAVPTLQYSRNPGGWATAVAQMIGPSLAIIAAELNHRLDDSLWTTLPREDARTSLARLAAVWRLLLTMTGIAANLNQATNVQGSSDRRHGVSAVSARSSCQLRQAHTQARLPGSQHQQAETATAVTSAREAFKECRREAERAHTELWRQKLLGALEVDRQAADCEMSPRRALPRSCTTRKTLTSYSREWRTYWMERSVMYARGFRSLMRKHGAKFMLTP